MATNEARMKCNAVNHKFLAAGGHNFCHECGISLSGKSTERTCLLNALTAAKDKALLAIPSAIGFTQSGLQEIADVCIAALEKANARKG